VGFRLFFTAARATVTVPEAPDGAAACARQCADEGWCKSFAYKVRDDIAASTLTSSAASLGQGNCQLSGLSASLAADTNSLDRSAQWDLYDLLERELCLQDSSTGEEKLYI
jgi:hypothetical protein